MDTRASPTRRIPCGGRIANISSPEPPHRNHRVQLGHYRQLLAHPRHRLGIHSRLPVRRQARASARRRQRAHAPHPLRMRHSRTTHHGGLRHPCVAKPSPERRDEVTAVLLRVPQCTPPIALQSATAHANATLESANAIAQYAVRFQCRSSRFTGQSPLPMRQSILQIPFPSVRSTRLVRLRSSAS